MQKRQKTTKPILCKSPADRSQSSESCFADSICHLCKLPASVFGIFCYLIYIDYWLWILFYYSHIPKWAVQLFLNLLTCTKLDGLSLASVWPLHKNKRWSIPVSLKMFVLSHTCRHTNLDCCLGFFNYDYVFYSEEELVWSLWLQTALFLLASPVGLLPSLLPVEQELLQPPDAEHSGSFPEGPSPSVPYFQRQKGKTNSTSCTVTADKLTGLLRNKHRGEQVVTFTPAYLHSPCQGKHCSSWWTFHVVSSVLEN